ncbi:hypothetical protein AB4068_00855 [Arthrobacter sp. 2RAF22]|uniref:hypothetical protein n=1 Tax=Arthrobacter sp. 2RAF22 TaxID=3232996 RepID=UPI003F8F6AD9
MLTDFIPDPWLFTQHQWGILLGGFVGAALSALIAVGVLFWTLRTQRKHLDAQLVAQSASLDAQLKAQAHALETQLEAQAGEASKQRELAARAELIVAVQELQNRPGDLSSRLEVCSRIANGIERMRFELHTAVDQPLWTELFSWRIVFRHLTFRTLNGEVPGTLTPRVADQLLMSASAQLLNALVEFRRNVDGKNWTAAEVARVLREFRMTSLSQDG